MADIFDQVAEPEPQQTRVDVFDRVAGGEDTPQYAHEVLPHPTVVDQATTQIARSTVEAATRPAEPATFLGMPRESYLSRLIRGYYDPTVEGGLAQMIDQATTSGSQQIRQGAHAIASEPGLKAKAEGAHQVISGTFEGLSPTLIPAALAAPIATAVSLGAGIGSQKATKAILKRSGVPDEYADLASDVVAIVAAGAGSKLHGKLRQATVDAVHKQMGIKPPSGDIFDQVAKEKPNVTQPAAGASQTETQPQSSPAKGPGSAQRTEPGQQQLQPAQQQAGAQHEPAQEGQKPVLAGSDLDQAKEVFRRKGLGSTSSLQRELGWGYGRAAHALDELTTQGFLAPGEAGKPRALTGNDAPAAPSTIENHGPAAPSTRETHGPNREYFRGDWDIPLNEAGRSQVKAAGERNARQFHEIFAGTKSRHQATAKAYLRTNPQAHRVETNSAFDPMHLGEHEGEEATPERLAQLNEHITQRPDEPIPGVGQFSGSPGEAPNAWKDRLIGAVQDVAAKWRPGKRVLVVTSGRDVQAIRAWAAKGMPADKSVDAGVLMQRWETQPGEMARLDPSTGKITNVQKASGDGIYFARHGETDGNDNPAVPADVQKAVQTGANRTQPVAPQPQSEPPQPNLQPNAATSAAEEPRPPARAGEVYLGAGLGAFEPYFRESIAETKAKLAARQAARAELEKSKATPDQVKLGNDVLHYITSENDWWTARSNQALERGRRLIPDDTEQVALGLWRQAKNNPQELQQFLAGTHPALRAIEDPAKFDAAMNAIARLRPAIERAQRPLTQQMKDVDQVLTNIAAMTANEGVGTGVLDRTWNNQTYVPQLLNRKGEGALPKDVDEAVRMIGGNFGQHFGFAEQRRYPTVLHAIADGIVPKTVNPFDAFTIQQSAFARARATRLLEPHLEELGMGIRTIREEAPEGWVPLARHSDEFRRRAEIPGHRGDPHPEDPLMPWERYQGRQPDPHIPIGETDLFVHPVIEQALRPLTDPDALSRLGPFRKIRDAQAAVKQAKFAVSFFHPWQSNLSALWDMGPKGWAQWLRHGDRFNPLQQEVERDLIASGGTTTVTGHSLEVRQRLEPGRIPTWSDVWRKTPLIKTVDELAQDNINFTFDRQIRSSKIFDFMLHREAWLKAHPNATPSEYLAAKRSIASTLNEVYGGLHWANMRWNKMAVEISRFFIMAPDYTMSHFFLMARALEGAPSTLPAGAGRLARLGDYSARFAKATAHQTAEMFHLQKKLPAKWEGTAGSKLARSFFLRQTIGGLVMNQAASLLLTGHMSKRPFEVYLGTDENGQEIYQNIFFRGVAGDVLTLYRDIARFGMPTGTLKMMANKAAPGLGTIGMLIYNEDRLHRPIVREGMNAVAKTAREMIFAAKDASPIPISVVNAWDMLTGRKNSSYTVPEYFTTAITGGGAFHIPPEGMRLNSDGELVEKSEPDDREENSTLDQIRTGKVYGGEP